MMVSSLGRVICGALAMPTIARVMGAILLQLSHSVPWVRVIIASRPSPPPPSPPPLPPPLLLPPAPAPAPSAVGADDLLRFWNCTQECAQAALGLQVSDRDNANNADIPVQVVAGGDDVASGEFSTTVLSRFLATSHEWATSDPVWYDVFCFLVFFALLFTNGRINTKTIGGEMLSDFAFSSWSVYLFFPFNVVEN